MIISINKFNIVQGADLGRGVPLVVFSGDQFLADGH